MRRSGRPVCCLLEPACVKVRKVHAHATEVNERIQRAQSHGAGEALDGVVRMPEVNPQLSAHLPCRRCVWVQNQRSLHMGCTGLDLIRLRGGTAQYNAVCYRILRLRPRMMTEGTSVSMPG